MSQETKDSIFKTLDNLALTPYPALLLGSSLLLKGITQPAPISATGSSGGSAHFSQRLALTKPTRASCYTFGAANLVGAWLSYDGEPVNAAGFNFAWASLYLIVNGGPGVKSLFKARVTPFAISVLALGNAGLYGKKFFWPSG
ncbi:uncharacterized protein CANTADRAFT_47391 [Suhomyces tanzawaensis NRRL Y-17324]|uniref:Altered inheritance of mitochondria protein 19, mitochondrial n=1 Tax=Suhomyces tanzawaensis NRRL Y-17324 TaxID=984487 RepID=A0A1E4SNY1_9ASCO|nr:uncharacterized protein CANTADRAFT_47391 [Suhomyces tanzawaensis NRRL Y-17324]ODV81231.1 hypothetical protein CANTADRAFT_47391 [Suhomyces tanzawaensis NRRL Y-17324]